MFSYILVVSTDYILLISIFPMLRGRKMKSIGSNAKLAVFAKLFKNYFRRVQKVWRIFTQLYKNFIDCFVLEFSTVDLKI